MKEMERPIRSMAHILTRPLKGHRKRSAEAIFTTGSTM